MGWKCLVTLRNGDPIEADRTAASSSAETNNGETLATPFAPMALGPEFQW